jgi:hypothetical protein
MSASKYAVCPACEGEGYVGSLGAFTSDEFHESFVDADDYMDAHEASKVACECCNGLRVVTPADVAEWHERVEDERMRAAEMGYFGGRY